MKKAQDSGKSATALMDMLANEDGMLRQKARLALVKLGKSAVPSLIRGLQSSQPDQVRWESAKALGAIGDVRSIPALVNALEDGESGVAWLAAEALCQFKRIAWAPLLRALIERGAASVPLRQGAHHILLKQKEETFCDALAALMKALESNTVPVATVVAASALLKCVEAET